MSIPRTAGLLWQDVAETLKPAELTPAQYNVLRILRGSGSAGRSRGEISERMVTKDSDITRRLDRLEARGLVRRRRGRYQGALRAALFGRGAKMCARAPLTREKLFQASGETKDG